MTREEMRNRIQATLNESEDYCARCQHCDRQLDALVDAVWPDVERLQGRFDFADQKVREWSAAAERAEAKQQAVADLIADWDLLPGGAYIPIGPLRDALDADQPAEAVTDLHAAIRAVLTACLTGEALPLVELAVAYESATGWKAEGRP